jgi:beta-galactosidase/beta-glucuronidase
MPALARRLLLALACAFLALAPAAAAAPRPMPLSSGWEVRDQAGDPAAPQPPPPEESAESEQPSAPVAPPTQDPSQNFNWRGATVPSVFDSQALAPLYPGQVRRYRIRFRGPATPRGFSWLVAFESARRGTAVYLNGRRLGVNRDPYTPFAFEARGLRPNRTNELFVVVDSRKDPRVSEGWWNWGGIVRPVKLVPVGRAYLEGLGAMPAVRCRRAARACRARLRIDAMLERRGARAVAPVLDVRLRSPSGRVTRKSFRLGTLRRASKRVRLSMAVPGPLLWSPERPALYSARFQLRNGGRVEQIERKRIGLRSVQVKRGLLYLNNRRIVLRGASIHEDMPGSGAALTRADMDRIVSDLKELGANVTRAHYLLNDRLLSRLDRAGIMVWNQAPIWQRDHRANLLQYPAHRRRALLTVRRTVKAARSHPSVITHSVANELSFTPDWKTGTRLFLTAAARYARDLDPTIPISVDIKGRPGFPEQFTYYNFDMLGINQYFGWYRWVENFDELEPFLREMRDIYPRLAIVNTEFGSEARPELASAPPDLKGGYAFQADHTRRTLEVLDRQSWLSGAIYWTLREFEIYPGWTGGAGRRPPEYEPNTRHHKGLLGYTGEKKPAWFVARDAFARRPLYATGR